MFLPHRGHNYAHYIDQSINGARKSNVYIVRESQEINEYIHFVVKIKNSEMLQQEVDISEVPDGFKRLITWEGRRDMKRSATMFCFIQGSSFRLRKQRI
jgi:hypothetical protein